jgi:hypothetical protein
MLSIFLEKVFDMDFLQNMFMVFLNSPYREAPKNVQKEKTRKKQSAGGWVGLGFSKCTGGSVDLFLAAPRNRRIAPPTRWPSRGPRGLGHKSKMSAVHPGQEARGRPVHCFAMSAVYLPTHRNCFFLALGFLLGVILGVFRGLEAIAPTEPTAEARLSKLLGMPSFGLLYMGKL